MIIFKRGFATFTALLLFSMTLISTQQVQFTDASTACVSYQSGINTITINCDASFLNVVQAINDPEILEQEEEDDQEGGQYILKANLDVADGVSFAMTSNQNGLQYLKIAGENGIIVFGRILIDGVKITSWDISDEDVIQQNIN